MEAITLADIRAAAERIRPYAYRTPVFTSRFFDERTGGRVYFKAENMQKVGAFKFRGACNAVFSLTDAEAQRGVTTHSSGNHAQALALSAKLRGIPATIVMNRTAQKVKRAAVEGYGATVIPVEPTEEARRKGVEEIVTRTNAVFIPPFNDRRVIAGQGTAALELIEDHGPFGVIVAPVGGGGLLSGTAIATKALLPNADVIAAEPAGADDAARSFRAGRIIPMTQPNTIADGLLTSLGELTFAVIRRHVRDVVTVSEEEIITAMRTVWERMKIIIEPSSAVPVAALLHGKVNARGKKVGVILSGGNVDLDKLPWLNSPARL